MKTAIELLHAEVESHWSAAGSPPGSTEMWLWEMTRHIDKNEPTLPEEEVLREGIELLDAWIDVEGHTTQSTEKETREAVRLALIEIERAQGELTNAVR